MRKFILQVVVTPNEDGSYVAEVPALPACISNGRTRAEALANVRKAAKLYMETLGEENCEFSRQSQMAEVEVTI
jgi:predicted RNase H-like HicB family nuclease